MTKREQIIHERQTLIIKLLVSEGIIEKKEADIILGCRSHNEASELVKGLIQRRNGRNGE